MSIADRIKEARKKKGWSKSELGRRVEVARQTVHQWETGVTAPNRTHAPVVAKVLGIPLSQVGADPSANNVEFLSSPAQSIKVPLIDWVSAGQGAQPSDPYPVGQGTEMLQVEFSVSENTFALEIRGVSMLPEFREGDRIIIDPNVEPLPNDYVVVKLDSKEECTFKKYVPRGTASDGTKVFDLVPENPDEKTITVNAANPGHIVGTMVEHRKRYRR